MMYPNRSEERVRKYYKHRLLREGKHEEAFKEEISKYGKAFNYDRRMGHPTQFMTVNLPREICRVNADLMFNDFPSVRTDDPEVEIFIENAINQLKLGNLFFESFDFGCALGDIIFKIRVFEGRLTVEPVNPEQYHPVYSNYELISHDIWHPVTFFIGNNEKEGVLIESYAEDGVYYNLYDTEYNEYPLPYYSDDLEDFTELDNALQYIVHIKNSGSPFSLYGTSDLEDITDLLFEADNRTSRIASILNKHSAPILKVPAGYAEKLAQGKSVDLVEILEKEEDINIEYISWDGKLEDSFNRLNDVVDMILTLSNISPSLVNRSKGNKAESGEALKYRLFRTLAMKRRKERYWSDGLSTLFYNLQVISQNLQAEVGGIIFNGEPSKVDVVFSEEFFDDEDEVLEREVTKLQNGLTTKEKVIQKVNSVDYMTALKMKEETTQED